jgi:hypothetical protein
VRWALVAVLCSCSFPHGIAPERDAPGPIVDAPNEVTADAEAVCHVGVTSTTGSARGRVGGDGGGNNFPPLACANATDRIVGIALKMSDQDTIFGSRSAQGIQIACAPVTVTASGVGATGTITTYEVVGIGTNDWAPSTWTPITQCKPGWLISGLSAHTTNSDNLFLDATITCAQITPTGMLGPTEDIYVVGSLDEQAGTDSAACNAGEILVRFTERTGSGLDSVDLYCTKPTCT